MNDYLEEPNNNINYKNLLNLSSIIEDIYEDKLNELKLCVNEIKNIYTLEKEELKKNYLNDFNKKYCLNNLKIEDIPYIGFRNDNLLGIILDQAKFNDLCRIDFKNIIELELRLEDDINIDVLAKATYQNICFLGLTGKIKDFDIFKKFPFKLLTTLRLSLNNFYNTNIDIFRFMPFNKLKRLLLDENKINNIEGLSKAPFYELIELNLDNNSINDLKPIIEFPFKKLESLCLDNNCIENIQYLSNAPFENLKYLSLRINKINNIIALSNVKFKGLEYLLLDNNEISNIEVFSRAPFTNLNRLFLRDNKIEDINVFKKASLISLSDLRLNHNKINNFEALFMALNKKGLNIYLDRRQYFVMNTQSGILHLNYKFNAMSE